MTSGFYNAIAATMAPKPTAAPAAPNRELLAALGVFVTAAAEVEEAAGRCVLEPVGALVALALGEPDMF
jgi:hypothetical protein